MIKIKTLWTLIRKDFDPPQNLRNYSVVGLNLQNHMRKFQIEFRPLRDIQLDQVYPEVEKYTIYKSLLIRLLIWRPHNPTNYLVAGLDLRNLLLKLLNSAQEQKLLQQKVKFLVEYRRKIEILVIFFDHQVLTQPQNLCQLVDKRVTIFWTTILISLRILVW